MAFDPSKLTPAPWVWEGRYLAAMVPGGRPNGEVIAQIDPNRLGYGKDTDGAFIALARNAWGRWYKRDPEAAMAWLTEEETHHDTKPE